MKNLLHKSFFIVAIGQILNCYDLFLYGFLSVSLVPIFFETDSNSTVSLSLGFMTFSLGFVARPLGGILFGHIGDRLGRKKALLFSLLLLSTSTLMIGVIPSYHQVGIWASVLLIIARLAQGIAVGGETPGTQVCMIEFSDKKNKGLASSLVSTMSASGNVLAAIVGFLSTLSCIQNYGWRWGFIIGGIIGFLFFFLRIHLEETPVFEKIKKDQKIEKVPLLVAFKKCPKNFLLAFGISAVFPSAYFISIIYGTGLLQKNLSFTMHKTILITGMVNALAIFLNPLFGYISGFIGTKNLMKFGFFLLLIGSYPLFLLIDQTHNLINILCFQISFITIGTMILAPAPAVFTSFFPPELRYSGVGFSWTFGLAILGGNVPLISTKLVEWANTDVAPAFFLMTCSLLGIFCLTCSESKH